MRQSIRPAQHGFRWWLVVYLAPRHHLNQCSRIFNRTLRNKLKWSSNHSTKLLIQVNSFESDFCEMAVILSRPQCVNSSLLALDHYNDVIMDAIVSEITSLTIVYSIVYSDAYQRKHQSSASLAFVRGFHREPVNSPHKWPVTRKMFPFDDVIMTRMFHDSWVINLALDVLVPSIARPATWHWPCRIRSSLSWPGKYLTHWPLGDLSTISN